MSDDNFNDVQDDESDEPTFTVSDTTYNRLRFLVLILLPGIGALYFGVAQIWGLPKAEEVVGTITVVDAFGGLFVRSLRRSYENNDARFDGQVIVTPRDEVSSDVNIQMPDTAPLATKDEVVLKVKRG